MRWFLTADNVLIPDRLIGRINRAQDGSAIAQVFDQQGRSSTATLAMNFDPLVAKLTHAIAGEDDPPPPTTIENSR